MFNAPRSGDKYATLCSEAEATYFEEHGSSMTQPYVTTKKKMNKKGKLHDNNRLPFAIKVMQMCNAQGECSPFVCIISVLSFEAKQWHVERVRGLTHTGSMGVGFLYFAKNRCGTEEMWKHYYLHVALPTIKTSNQNYGDVDRDPF